MTRHVERRRAPKMGRQTRSVHSFVCTLSPVGNLCYTQFSFVLPTMGHSDALKRGKLDDSYSNINSVDHSKLSKMKNSMKKCNSIIDELSSESNLDFATLANLSIDYSQWKNLSCEYSLSQSDDGDKSEIPFLAAIEEFILGERTKTIESAMSEFDYGEDDDTRSSAFSCASDTYFSMEESTVDRITLARKTEKGRILRTALAKSSIVPPTPIFTVTVARPFPVHDVSTKHVKKGPQKTKRWRLFVPPQNSKKRRGESDKIEAEAVAQMHIETTSKNCDDERKVTKSVEVDDNKTGTASTESLETTIPYRDNKKLASLLYGPKKSSCALVDSMMACGANCKTSYQVPTTQPDSTSPTVVTFPSFEFLLKETPLALSRPAQIPESLSMDSIEETEIIFCKSDDESLGQDEKLWGNPRLWERWTPTPASDHPSAIVTQQALKKETKKNDGKEGPTALFVTMLEEGNSNDERASILFARNHPNVIERDDGVEIIKPESDDTNENSLVRMRSQGNKRNSILALCRSPRSASLLPLLPRAMKKHAPSISKHFPLETLNLQAKCDPVLCSRCFHELNRSNDDHRTLAEIDKNLERGLILSSGARPKSQAKPSVAHSAQLAEFPHPGISENGISIKESSDDLNKVPPPVSKSSFDTIARDGGLINITSIPEQNGKSLESATFERSDPPTDSLTRDNEPIIRTATFEQNEKSLQIVKHERDTNVELTRGSRSAKLVVETSLNDDPASPRCTGRETKARSNSSLFQEVPPKISFLEFGEDIELERETPLLRQPTRYFWRTLPSRLKFFGADNNDTHPSATEHKPEIVAKQRDKQEVAFSFHKDIVEQPKRANVGKSAILMVDIEEATNISEIKIPSEYVSTSRPTIRRLNGFIRTNQHCQSMTTPNQTNVARKQEKVTKKQQFVSSMASFRGISVVARAERKSLSGPSPISVIFVDKHEAESPHITEISVHDILEDISQNDLRHKGRDQREALHFPETMKLHQGLVSAFDKDLSLASQGISVTEKLAFIKRSANPLDFTTGDHEFTRNKSTENSAHVGPCSECNEILTTVAPCRASSALDLVPRYDKNNHLAASNEKDVTRARSLPLKARSRFQSDSSSSSFNNVIQRLAKYRVAFKDDLVETPTNLATGIPSKSTANIDKTLHNVTKGGSDLQKNAAAKTLSCFTHLQKPESEALKRTYTEGLFSSSSKSLKAIILSPVTRGKKVLPSQQANKRFNIKPSLKKHNPEIVRELAMTPCDAVKTSVRFADTPSPVKARKMKNSNEAKVAEIRAAYRRDRKEKKRLSLKMSADIVATEVDCSDTMATVGTKLSAISNASKLTAAERKIAHRLSSDISILAKIERKRRAMDKKEGASTKTKEIEKALKLLQSINASRHERKNKEENEAANKQDSTDATLPKGKTTAKNPKSSYMSVFEGLALFSQNPKHE